MDREQVCALESVRAPIGLREVVSAVRREAARKHGTPPHLLVRLRAGDGRSTLAAFVAETYAQSRRRDFSSPDLFLEYALGGAWTLPRIAQDASFQAGYANDFVGVLALDATALLTEWDGEAPPELLRGLTRLGETATLLLFLPPEREAEALSRHLQEALPDLEAFAPAPYGEEELLDIAQRSLEDEALSPAALSRLRESLRAELRARAWNGRGVTARTVCALKRRILRRMEEE